MTNAIEARRQMEELRTKRLNERKEKTIKWCECIVEDDIQMAIEKGLNTASVFMPEFVEVETARKYLTDFGYIVGHAGHYIGVRW